MNFGQTQDLSNANIYSTEPSLIKRKDPKKMTLSELDEYINKNKSRLKTESESPKKEENFPPPNRENIPSQREDDSNTFYIQELESKINYLENENEELKRNFAQLSELLEKERNEQHNKIQDILYRNEQKFLADNKNLLKQIDDLKLQDSINKTNISMLNSEKERHIEQNAIDKEYYEGQINNLIKENEELKEEIRDKVNNFSSVIKEQEKTLENEFKLQLKTYKEIINRNEKDKKDLIKKYENKIHEMQVRINRLERGEAKSKSKSKGKYSSLNNISVLSMSSLSKSARSKSKSRSKSKGKIKKINNTAIENTNNNILFTLKPNESACLNTSNLSGSFSNYQSLTAINDEIFKLERNIGDLNYNYKQMVDKMKSTASQDEIKTLNRNIQIVKNNIDEQMIQLNNLKLKQQEFLKNGFIKDEI